LATMHPIVRLRAQAMGFAYPGVSVFEGLDFLIGPGLSIILGGDGRGKTTLLRLLAGELTPSTGKLERVVPSLFSADPHNPDDDTLSARQWLARHRARYPSWDEALEARLIEGFSLEVHRDKQLFMLSTGTRRKIWLTAAFACGASLVLLETPFSALDLPSRRHLAGLLRECAEARSQAVVIADHALPDELAGMQPAACVALGD
jgi:ABC-type multidrug transport system ATPase subunit